MKIITILNQINSKITSFLILIIISLIYSQSTTLVADINHGQAGSYPKNFIVANGVLYFAADNGTHGEELWKYDRKKNPPEMVMDIRFGNLGSKPESFFVYDNKLYFSAYDGPSGRELWVYDFINPPVLAADIFPGPDGSGPRDFIVFNGVLYFSAYTEEYGREIWKFDGVNDPTLAVEVNPGITTSHIGYLTLFNNKIYFTAFDEAHWFEIWAFDGNNPPTVQSDEINPGAVHSFPKNLTVFNNALYFSALDPVFGIELFKLDGINPPVLIKDIGVGVNGEPRSLTIFNNKLYFSVVGATTGRELWVYDGVNDPVMVDDIRPGSGSSYPTYLEVYNNKLYFLANDGMFGEELWVYDDGTALKDMIMGTFDTGPLKGVRYKEANIDNWIEITSIDHASQVAGGDIDGDGHDDFIGVYTEAAGPGVWIKYSATGEWSSGPITSDIPVWVASGDLNGGGKDDFLGSFGNGVWYWNQGWVQITQMTADQVAAGDFDGDGTDDLLAVYTGPGVTDAVWIKYSSTGNWDPIYLINSQNPAPNWIAAGDMDGDGLADFVGSFNNGVRFRYTATETWEFIYTDVHITSSMVTTGDLDADGYDDLVAHWNELSEVWVRYAYPAPGVSRWTQITTENPHWITTGKWKNLAKYK